LRRAGFGEVVRFTASDISEAALALALQNAVSQGVADLIDLRVADLLSTAIEIGDPPGVIVANLPYVATATLDALGPTIAFEPRLALDGGPDGLDVIRRLLAELPRVLARDGVALLEIGADQAALATAAAADALPGWPTTIHPDLAGLPRVMELERPLA
jgi:release factor glutamine methyltransferase